MAESSVIGRTAAGEVVTRSPIGGEAGVFTMTPADETHELALESKGCWSPVVLWNPLEGGDVVFHVYRASTVEGRLETQRQPPRTVEGRIFFVSAVQAKNAPRSNGLPVSCELEFPQWRCTVPANTPFDLRLEFPGFGAAHYWSVAATPGAAAELEPHRLIAGASISGWIKDPAGTLRKNAAVTLSPLEAHEARADEGRLAARRRSVRTNERGFFQFSGLEPGAYRLVSELEGLSAAVLPEVRVREGESLVWPTAIAHVELAELQAGFYPAVDLDGEPWLVELKEVEPLHLDRQPPLRKRAGADGRWSARSLRAGLYELIVRDKSGSEIERAPIDLSEGGARTIALNVRTLRVRGVLRMGNEPLQAAVSFSNLRGKSVRVSTDERGQFEGRFPVGGEWWPEVRYPLNQYDNNVVLDPVAIVPDAHGEARLELTMPGGRIRGEVVTAEGTGVRSGVYVWRNGRIVAQMITPDTGKFDFVGIAAGDYEVNAEAAEGATPEKIQVTVEEDAAATLRLALAPSELVAGVVLTPAGTPASGAVIHILKDGGRNWIRAVTDVSGRFEYRRPAGSDGGLVVITYSHPSAIIRVPATHRGGVVITLPPDGGILRIRNGKVPYIRSGQAAAPMRAFYFPDPVGRFNGGVYLGTGTYLVCPSRQEDATCRTVTIAPGRELELNFEDPAGARQ